MDIDFSIGKVLEKNFKYGMNINSPIEIMRFKRYYALENRETITYDDESLVSMIKTQGFEFNGKVFIISEENLSALLDAVDCALVNNTTIIYYSDYYEVNEEWLNSVGVYSAEMLRAVLELHKNTYTFRNNYFLGSGESGTEIIAIERNLKRIWGDTFLRSISDIDNIVKYIPIEKIKWVLSYSNYFIWNSFETYFYVNNFRINDNQKHSLIEIVSEECSRNGSISFDELDLEDLYNDNYEISESAMYDSVMFLLGPEFEKNNRIISKKGQSIDAKSAIKDFCKDKKRCTFKELEMVMESVAGIKRHADIVSAANDVMVRINNDTFVKDCMVTFNSDLIDSILEDVIIGDAVGLKEISSFAAFPYCGAAWNLFLLESYCRRFSKKFRYECVTPNSRNAGAIVKKESPLSYHELMIEALAKASITLSEKESLDYLVSTGYLSRRQYSNIDDLLHQATLKKGD